MHLNRFRIFVVAFATCLLALGASVPAAGANPLDALLAPSHDPASLLPTPLGDSFYTPPPGFERQAPGTVLAARPIPVNLLVVPAAATELLVRSTDTKGHPVAVTAVLLVPAAPWVGARPVVAYNFAIDSLGHTCVPSYQMRTGLTAEIVPAQRFLAKGYAVLSTDHQGPRQAYAAGRMAAHAVLDALRAAVRQPGLDPRAPLAITGYSGGAIASGWAAELAPTYAPELNLVGAAFGGTPADYSVLLGSMSGRNLASSVFLGAALGVAREYPELLTLLNDNGWRLAYLAKDLCLGAMAVPGAVFPVPVTAMSDHPDVLNTPVVQQVLADTRMGRQAPRAPVFIYHGTQEFWIPRENSVQLQRDWCAQGASVQLEEYTGEHLVVAIAGMPAAYSWIDDRLAGVPAPKGCSHRP